MTVQYDVKSGHLNQSGFITQYRVRLKQIDFIGNGSQAGSIQIFDTSTAPTTAVYARSGTTVTVTKSSHGLVNGDSIGIAYSSASGNSATDGNYTITYVDANTFTITDPNSGTVSGGTACAYVTGVNKWMTAFDTLSGTTSGLQVLIPGEGMLAQQGLYVQMQYITYVTIFYG